MNRWTRKGAVPPACEKMKLMSGKRAAVPLKIRLAIVRVVSVPSSIVDALSHLGVTDVERPATPERVWRAIQEAKS